MSEQLCGTWLSWLRLNHNTLKNHLGVGKAPETSMEKMTRYLDCCCLQVCMHAHSTLANSATHAIPLGKQESLVWYFLFSCSIFSYLCDH